MVYSPEIIYSPKASDEVKQEKAKISIENMVKDQQKCVKCNAISTMKCGGCMKVFYCSRVHQKLDWNTHKNLCETVKKS